MKNLYGFRIGSGIAAAAVLLIGGVVSAQSAVFTSEFGIGTSGSEVTSLQTWLEDNGYYNGPVTGYFGTLTLAGVENFQSANGITATGYVGPLTLAALNTQASGSTTVSANSTTLAQLEAELNSLLAQIQALEGNTTTATSVPTGSSSTLETNENVSLGGTLIASGNGTLTYTLDTEPQHGAVTSFNSMTGAFTYTPNNDYTGADSFTYTVGNSAGVSAPVTVTLNVEPSSVTSGAPTAQSLSFSTSGGVAYNGTLSASGNTPYTYSIVTEPSHGSISNFNSSTGAFTYMPTVNYTGSDTFTYTVSNSAGVSSPVTVTVNDGSSTATGAPTGQAISLSTANGAALNGTLAASGAGPYTFQIVSNPSWGTISNLTPSLGSFTYTPNPGYTGTDSFTYEVGNTVGTSSSYTVTITD